MSAVEIVFWEEDGAWLGYLREYADYWTQGKSIEDLRAHLRDLYRDVTSGEIPRIRKMEG
jgi:predicted RNase H-like HicB family nuclease